MKILLLMAFIFSTFSTPITAEICPSPNEIEEGHLKGWILVDSLSNEPIDDEDGELYAAFIETFYEGPTNFTSAKWSSNYPFGNGCCNYDTGLDISLAKTVPKPIGANWHGNTILHCYSNQVSNCPF